MTKEIIDGIDVSGCEYYDYCSKDGSCMSQDCDYTLCRLNECLYKQLKRLEQENAKLKEENVKLKSAIKEIKIGAVYGSANSQHFLHNIFEDIIKICEVLKDE